MTSARLTISTASERLRALRFNSRRSGGANTTLPKLMPPSVRESHRGQPRLPHPPGRIAAKVRVVPHPGAHAWLGQLEDDRCDSADEDAGRIAEHAPGHRIGTKDARITSRF